MRVARQLDRAADRIQQHGWVTGSDAARRDHHIGFDMAGAIKPRANNPSPAIVSLAYWYAAEAIYGHRLPYGMLYSPRRVLEDFSDSYACDAHWAVTFLRRAATQARADAKELALRAVERTA